MSIMQIKRGTTDSWKLGTECVDFEQLAIRDKDSVIDCCKNTITMTIGAPSMNAMYNGAEKSPCIHIIKDAEFLAMCTPTALTSYILAVKVDPLDPAKLETAAHWGIKYQSVDSSQATKMALCGGNNPDNITTKNKISYYGSGNLVVWWDATLCKNPFPVKITVSFREANAVSMGEGLAPGQLGAEYLPSGGTALKIGPHGNDNDCVAWPDIKYVGQVLPPCMYGSEADRDSIVNPVPGQIFYVKST